MLPSVDDALPETSAFVSATSPMLDSDAAELEAAADWPSPAVALEESPAVQIDPSGKGVDLADPLRVRRGAD